MILQSAIVPWRQLPNTRVHSDCNAERSAILRSTSAKWAVAMWSVPFSRHQAVAPKAGIVVGTGQAVSERKML